MNNDNPLIPQGSLFEEKAKSQARVKKAFFFALSASVLTLLIALIVQGCKREQPQIPPEPLAPEPTFDTNYTPVVDTNLPPPAVDTNIAPPIVDTAPPPQPIPAATTEHTIAKGEYLSTIAKKYGVSLKAILEANPGVDPKRLQIGKKLNIPAPTAAAVSGSDAVLSPAAVSDSMSAQTYPLKSGDNLTKIAPKLGVTLKALRSANNLKTDRIKVGDKLKIPVKAGAPVAEPVPAPAPAPAAPYPSEPAAMTPPVGTPPAR